MKKLQSFLLLGGFSASLAVAPLTIFAEEKKTSSFSTQQIEEIKKIIHDDWINNPEVLVEVAQALEMKKQAKTQEAAQQAIKANIKEVFAPSNVPSVYQGTKTPTLFVVEFSDYQCIHCKSVAPAIEAFVKENKNVKVIFRELPIFGPDSEYAAKAALASAKQGKYFAFHNALFKSTERLTNDQVDKIAAQVGINVKQLKKDLSSDADSLKNQLNADRELAENLYVTGTPAFILGGKVAEKTGLPTQFYFQEGELSKASLEKLAQELR